MVFPNIEFLGICLVKDTHLILFHVFLKRWKLVGDTREVQDRHTDAGFQVALKFLKNPYFFKPP